MVRQRDKIGYELQGGPVMGVKILIVEAERIVADDIASCLKGIGYKVSGIVPTGEQAIEIMEKQNPALVLMDVMLQGKMDGIDAADEIKKRFGIPIIFLTARTDKETFEEAKRTEPYGYIVKPFREKDLHSAIEIALYKSEMEKRIEHLNAVLAAIRGVNQLIIRERDRDVLLKSACDKLIETRGYSDAWIVLMGQDGQFSEIFEAGLNENLAPLMELLRHEEIPKCARKALNQTELVATVNPSMSCRYCPLLVSERIKGRLTIRLETRGNVKGLLSVSLPSNLVSDVEEQLLFTELAGDISFALHDIELDEKRLYSEKELIRLNRSLKTLSKCNIAMVHATDESALLEYVCKIIVNAGEYGFAWVGYVEKGDGKLRPVAVAGPNDANLIESDLSLADEGGDAVPVKEVLRTGRAVISNMKTKDPRYEIHRTEALKRGYASFMALPLREGKCTFGVINIFSSDPDAFDAEEVKLLKELSEDLAFGITTIRARREHRNAVEALRESEERYRDLFENANDLIQSVDTKGNFLYTNKAWREILGYDTEELENLSIFDIVHTDCREEYKNLFGRVVKGDVPDTVETVFVTKKGRRIMVEGCVNCRYEGGKAVSTRGIFRDITERKRAEAKLRKTQSHLLQSEKLAGMGTMAAGIAHEINNPLQVIMGMSEIIQDEESLEQIQEDVGDILGASEKIQNIVKNLSVYSRDAKTLKVQPLDLNKVIRKSISVARYSSNFLDIGVALDQERLPVIEGNPGELQQVFINLITNAIDAMEESGILSVRTRAEENSIRIEVSDTGKGISREELGNIFDPFFTTKDPGKGTGLGLYVIHQIVGKYGGGIEVESEVGNGTKFRIAFPAKDTTNG